MQYRVEGMRELDRMIRRYRRLPQKCVTKAARQGATIALRDARKNAPVLTGALLSGIILKAERTTKRGKKVYQVTFDHDKNDLFVKMTKGGKRYYYPASQEYGYVTKGGGYMPGAHYLRDSIDDNRYEIERKTVEVLTREMDKLR